MDKQKPISVFEFCSYMKKIFPEYLKDIPESDFLLLEDYLNYEEYEANQILKKPNETETKSRLVLSGFGVIMEMDEEGDYKVDRVYKQGEVLMDLYSFKFDRATPSLIKSYTKMKTAELTKVAEESLHQNLPQLMALSAVINDHIYLIEKSWIRILSEAIENRYEMFLQNFKTVSNHIKINDLADLLKTSYSTIKRIRKNAIKKNQKEKQIRKEINKKRYQPNPIYGYTTIDYNSF